MLESQRVDVRHKSKSDNAPKILIFHMWLDFILGKVKIKACWPAVQPAAAGCPLSCYSAGFRCGSCDPLLLTTSIYCI